MTYILCIETSTTNCSVALTGDSEVIGLKEDYNNSYSHAERLHNFITDVVNESGVSMKELSAVAISKGPGSYTGLRIGVAAAKGLCYALDIPLIALPTLKSLAMQVQETGDYYVVPMIDARRMEVYSSVFDSNTFSEVRETKAEVLTEDSFAMYLQEKKVYFIGNGVAKFAEICQHPNAIFIENKLPSANEMAMLSYPKFLKEDFEDVSYFDPYYLKDFVSG